MKKAWVVFVVVAMLMNMGLSTFSPVVSAQTQPDIYVSAADGNDYNSGTLSAPVRTIAKAKVLADQQIKQGLMTSDQHVWIKDGSYFIDSTINFYPDVSGNNGKKVIYSNYEDSKPVISAGEIISGWTEEPAGSGKFKKYVGTGYNINALWENGIRAVKARNSDIGAYDLNTYKRVGAAVPDPNDPNRLSKTQFKIAPGDVPVLGNIDGLEAVIWPGGPSGYWGWSQNTIPVNSIDGNTVTLNSSASYELGAGSRYFLQGKKEFWNVPGEFCIEDGWLYYYAYNRSNVISNTVIAPKGGVTNIINISGNVTPVSNLVFDGLTFAHTDKDNDAFQIGYAQDIEIKNCRIVKVGGNGVELTSGSQRVNVSGCEIAYTGKHGVSISGNTGNVKNNTITYNHIFKTGLIYGDSIGVRISNAEDNTISHNLIHDTPRYSIAILGKQGGSSYAKNNIVEYNDLSAANTDSQDSGLIHTYYTFDTNTIRNNKVHDSDMPLTTIDVNKSIGSGIYCDDGSDYTVVEKNLLYNLQKGTGGGVLYSSLFLKGLGTKAVNNIVANNKVKMAYIQTHEMNNCSNNLIEVERNVFYNNDCNNVYWHYNWEPDRVYKSNNNVIFNNNSMDINTYKMVAPSTSDPNNYPVPTPNLTTFAQWKTYSAPAGGYYDSNTQLVNPMFMDPNNNDFRLKYDSRAYEQGMVDINIEDIGLDSNYPFANANDPLKEVFIKKQNDKVNASMIYLGNNDPNITSDPVQLVLKGRTQRGYICNLTDATITYSSSDPNIASVNDSGVVTPSGDKCGTVKITAMVVKLGSPQVNAYIYVSVNKPKNTDFEFITAAPAPWSGSRPSGWGHNFSSGTPTLTVDGNHSYQGQKSLKISSANAATGYVNNAQQQMSFIPGETYTIKEFVKTDNIQGTGNDGFFSKLVFCDPNWVSLNKDVYITPTLNGGLTSDWKAYSTSFTVPAGCGKVAIYHNFKNAVGTVWVDNIQIHKNVLQNDDFEVINTDGTATKWGITATPPAGKTAAVVSIDSTSGVPKSGTQCLKIDYSSGTAWGKVISEQVPVIAGDEYTMNQWVKTQGILSTGFSFKVLVCFYNSGGYISGGDVTLANVTANTSGWTNYAKTFKAPAGAIKANIVYLYDTTSAAKGTVWVDAGKM